LAVNDAVETTPGPAGAGAPAPGAPPAGPVPPPEGDGYVGRRPAYWGLRPRKVIRRGLVLLLALLLAAALAVELVWLWRVAP